MIIQKIFVFLLISALLFPGLTLRAAEAPSLQKPSKIDVVLNVSPIHVKPLKDGKGADALEKPPEEMGPSAMIVVFRINRVLRGELRTVKPKQLSLWDQAKDAADGKNILKLVTMDFKRPEEEIPKESFSMVVADPYASFGIKEGEGSPKQCYKISLARVHKNPDSYLLVKKEKL